MRRQVVCYGDSNTYGYSVDPQNPSNWSRFDETQRWPTLLQKALGSGYRIGEEGLIGRTTAFADPLREGMNGLDTLQDGLLAHAPVDLLILMLGTNDVKERFGLTAKQIAAGMELLVCRAADLPVWRDDQVKILVIAPPHISAERDPAYHRKSAQLALYYQAVADRQGCTFLDAEGIGIFNTTDHMHLTQQGHLQLSRKVAELVPKLIG